MTDNCFWTECFLIWHFGEQLDLLPINQIGVMEHIMRLLLFIFFALGALLVWFWIPLSPMKAAFQKDVEAQIVRAKASSSQDVFSAEEFDCLPAAVQNYVRACGYLGKPKMAFMKMAYHQVEFMQARNKPALKIDYTQYNFVETPCRLALIDSHLFGIPFEGYDYYQDGNAGMQGVIAKGITLFHQKGTALCQASLVTFLAESLFAPAILLQNYITFQELSPYEVQATICHNGQTASGVFTFNDRYEMISFETPARAAVDQDGTVSYVPWSAYCTEYNTAANGIKYPSRFQAVWKEPQGDFVYFCGNIAGVSYDSR